MRIAIAGCGRIAFTLEKDPLRYKPCTHLGALRYLAARDRKLHMVGFCDTDLRQAQGAAEFMASDALITHRFTDLLRTKPDLLVIAASTAAHFPLLRAALAAKIPRIVIEKPVAFSANEAKLLRTLAGKSKSAIWPNYERRYHPKYIRLKQQIADAGQALSYRGFFAAGSSRRVASDRSGHERAVTGAGLYATKNGDEGVLLHDTTHLLDVAQYLFGPVEKHTVVAQNNRHVLHLEHAGGATGMIETNLGIGVFHLELEVRLPDRRITVGNGFTSTEKIGASRYYRALKSYTEPKRTRDARFPVTKNPFVQLYREALYGRPDNAHFYEALDNVVLLDKQRKALPVKS